MLYNVVMVTKYNIGGSIMKSKAFERFIQDRCEEILENDSEYQELNYKILEAQKKLKTLLSKKELDLFHEIEKLSIEQQNLGIHLCLSDIFVPKMYPMYLICTQILAENDLHKNGYESNQVLETL